MDMQASDVYSFGALLWSMCSGQMPWMGLSREEVTTQLVVEHRTLEFRDGFPPVLVVSNQGLNFFASRVLNQQSSPASFSHGVTAQIQSCMCCTELLCATRNWLCFADTGAAVHVIPARGAPLHRTTSTCSESTAGHCRCWQPCSLECRARFWHIKDPASFQSHGFLSSTLRQVTALYN